MVMIAYFITQASIYNTDTVEPAAIYFPIFLNINCVTSESHILPHGFKWLNTSGSTQIIFKF